MNASEIWKKSGFLDDKNIADITEKLTWLEDYSLTRKSYTSGCGDITLPIVRSIYSKKK